jgi:hypothetical protein
MKWLSSKFRLSCKFTQRIFTELPWFKVSLVTLISLLLIVSLLWVWRASTTPELREETVTLVKYEHQGKLDYTVYVKPNHLFGPPYPAPSTEEEAKSLYFTNIIKDIEVGYTYEFVRYSSMADVSSAVNIVAIIHGPSGWQKEVLLESDAGEGYYFTIDFPLELDKFDEIINTIEDELGIRAPTPEYEYTYEYQYVEGEGYVLVQVAVPAKPEHNVYDLTIEARVNVNIYTGPQQWIEDSFVQPMELHIDKGTLEWDNELNLSQREFYEGLIYEHRGNFDYTIELNENSLYGPDVRTLSPKPYEQPPVTPRPAGEVYFTQIVDIMRGNFSYQFVCDKPVTNLDEEVELTALLEYSDMWSKTFTLVPKSRESGDFTVNFIVDVNYLNELANTIGQETGVGVASLDLTIKAVVHTTADTDYGHIDKVFTHTLEGKLERGTLIWKGELDKKEPGTIEETRIIINPNVDRDRLLSRIVLALVLLGFAFIMWNVSRIKRPALEEEARRAKKKFKKVIVDVSELPAPRTEEVVIPFDSLNELATAADALLKPVLHQAMADKHVYCVIDGLIRYEYVSKLELPDKQKRTEDEHSQT